MYKQVYLCTNTHAVRSKLIFSLSNSRNIALQLYNYVGLQYLHSDITVSQKYQFFFIKSDTTTIFVSQLGEIEYKSSIFEYTCLPLIAVFFWIIFTNTHNINASQTDAHHSNRHY